MYEGLISKLISTTDRQFDFVLVLSLLLLLFFHFFLKNHSPLKDTFAFAYLYIFTLHISVITDQSWCVNAMIF